MNRSTLNKKVRLVRKFNEASANVERCRAKGFHPCGKARAFKAWMKWHNRLEKINKPSAQLRIVDLNDLPPVNVEHSEPEYS